MLTWSFWSSGQRSAWVAFGYETVYTTNNAPWTGNVSYGSFWISPYKPVNWRILIQHCSVLLKHLKPLETSYPFIKRNWNIIVKIVADNNNMIFPCWYTCYFGWTQISCERTHIAITDRFPVSDRLVKQWLNTAYWLNSGIKLYLEKTRLVHPIAILHFLLYSWLCHLCTS